MLVCLFVVGGIIWGLKCFMHTIYIVWSEIWVRQHYLGCDISSTLLFKINAADNEWSEKSRDEN